MLRNYIKIALRNLSKHKGYALINIAGLAVGVACCVLILLYVEDELSYDRYHTHADRIYRVVEYIGGEGGGEHSASAPLPVGAAVADEFPGLVQATVRFFNFQAPTLALAHQDRTFNEPRLFFTDASVFDVFSFTLLKGDPRTALAEPYSIVLTPAMVEKYFGTANPIGQVLRFENRHDLRVTGILAPVPPSSHFQVDFLASLSSLETMLSHDLRENWYWNPSWTYVLLQEGVSPGRLEALFPDFVQAHFPEIIREDLRLELQPLTRIHLHSALDYEIESNGSAANIYIFSVIALLVLLIACVNYTNLATARSTSRAREVGMRKTLGAYRSQLVRQFLLESVVLTFFAVVLAVTLVQVALPVFNAFAEKSLTLNLLANPWVLLSLLGVVLVVGVGAGLYPALVLSAYEPVRVLKSSIFTPLPFVPMPMLGLRKMLVVLQFAVSIVLIVGTGAAYFQLDHLLRAGIGFNKEQVVMLPVTRSPIAAHYEAFKEQLLSDPRIVRVTAVEEVLGAKHQTGNYQLEGMPESRLFPRLHVRHDFTSTFGIQMAAGRDFDHAVTSDVDHALLVNEAMVRQMGWSMPAAAVGKTFSHDGSQPAGQIIGVMKDFHFTSLRQPIAPLVVDLNTNPRAFDLFIKYVAVRIAPGDVDGALSAIQATWRRFVPEQPVDYFFLDTRLDQQYKAEHKLSRLAIAFALLAMGVACLGLFGLASFVAQQRTREIGIRKVMGASVASIVVLLSKDFARLVLVAFLVAAPLAFLATDRWLDSFAYRIKLSVWLFLVAGLAALVIALLTVGYQSVRAARINPSDSLRYE